MPSGSWITQCVCSLTCAPCRRAPLGSSPFGSPFGRSSPLRARSLAVVRSGWQGLAGVLTFSAVPFVAVQAFADSELGKQVFEDLKGQKKYLKKEAARVERERREVRNRSRWYGESRPKWLGPLDVDYPEYLKGEVAGDYGFDILRLGEDPADFEKYHELELLHGRWAMLAALGVFVPDVLNRTGVTTFPESIWWKVGGAKLGGEDLNYLGIEGLRIAGAQAVAVIASCQAVLMVGPEYARACGIDALDPVGWHLPGDINYPGSFLFDPLGLSNDPVFFEDAKVKEVKNGRLAMIAWVGFYTQALVTRKSPVDNLLDFVHDPAENNVLTYLHSWLFAG